MSVEAELAANRRNTTAFIAARPTTVALIPTVKTKSGTGGITHSAGQARVAQTFRLIESPSAYGNAPGKLQAGDGTQRRVTHQLLGEWDAEMAVDDYWIDASGARYQVIELLPYNGYERRAQVVFYG